MTLTVICYPESWTFVACGFFLLIMSLLQTSFLELQDRAHGWTHVRTACAVSNVVPIKEGTRNSFATEITS